MIFVCDFFKHFTNKTKNKTIHYHHPLPPPPPKKNKQNPKQNQQYGIFKTLCSWLTNTSACEQGTVLYSVLCFTAHNAAMLHTLITNLFLQQDHVQRLSG